MANTLPAAYETQAQLFYVAYYGRPADPLGLAYWADVIGKAGGNLSAVIHQFGSSAEAAEKYGSQSVADSVNALYNQMFGRDAEPAGLSWWVQQINQGNVTLADLPIQLFTGAQGADLVALENKLAVADAFTAALDTTAEILAYKGIQAMQGAADLLAGVDHTAGSVEAALESLEAVVAAIGTGGETFSFTASISDDLVGTAGNDVFRAEVTDSASAAAVTTLNAGDQADGAGGVDRLVVTAEDTATAGRTTVVGFQLDNIEELEIRAYEAGGANGVRLGLQNVSGLEKVISTNSTADIVLTDVKNLVELNLKSSGTDAIDFSVSYQPDAVAGDADEQVVVLNGFKGDELALGVSIGDAPPGGIEALAIETTGRASGIDAVVSTDLESLTVTGDEDLSIKAMVLDGGLKSVEAFVDGSAALSLGDDGEDVPKAERGIELAPDATVTTGGGGDQLRLRATGDVTVDAGGGDNLVEVFAGYGGESLVGASITTGDGDDQIIVWRDDDGTAGGPVTIAAGAGDNTITLGEAYGSYFVLTEGSSITALGGDDSLFVDGYIQGSVDLGEGDNSVTVDGYIDGSALLSFGDGDNSVVVYYDIEGSASLNFGDGDNVVSVDGYVEGSASLSFGDGNNQVAVGEDFGEDASLAFGDGDNMVMVYGYVWGEDASLSFGDGNNTVVVGNDIEDAASLSFGDGNNAVYVYDNIQDDASLTFGDGDNVVEVYSYIEDNASLSFGDGNNTVSAGVIYGSSTGNGVTLSFGDGDNSVDVGGDIDDATITFGNGNNELSAESLYAASVTAGSGADSVQIDDGIYDDSSIELGAGNDTLTVGAGSYGGAEIEGDVAGTLVDMGEGDDLVVLYGTQGDRYTYGNDDLDASTLVRSGASLVGGGGNDTLTVKAVDVVNLVGQTDVHEVKVYLDGSYAVGSVLTLTVGGVTASYTVLEEDIVQGNGAATSQAIAAKLLVAAAAKEDEFTEAGFELESWSAGTTEAGIAFIGGAVDANGKHLTVSATGMTVEVLQDTNAAISGFETLNLVALKQTYNDDDSSDVYTYDGCEFIDEAPTLIADFAFISGVQQVNLISEEALSPVTHDSDLDNGSYTELYTGGTTNFVLLNLPADLHDHIKVSGNEVTATGNVQVNRVTIGGGDGAHAIGDEITLTVGDQEFSLTVSASDLSGADAATDAANIAARLADLLIAAGQDLGFAVKLDDNQITLIGRHGESQWEANPVVVSLESDGTGDSVTQLQASSAVDDRILDVQVTALPAIDTDDDTLALEINGPGSFDLGLAAGDYTLGFGYYGSEPTPPSYEGFENLVLNVTDQHSHYIDTVGSAGGFVGGNITLQGGAAGEWIEMRVAAATVDASTSAANVGVYFDVIADANYHYQWYYDPAPDGNIDWVYDVKTGSGDDLVDMNQVLFTDYARVNAGAGTDRLIIGNGAYFADYAIGDDEFSPDTMWQHVRNVEELEVDFNLVPGGEDALALDSHAYQAGFEKLIIRDDVEMVGEDAPGLLVGDDFKRDLEIEAGDDVFIYGFQIDTDSDITMTAGEGLKVVYGEISSISMADVSITAGEDAYISIEHRGHGDLTLVAGEDSDIYVEIDNDDDGKVDITVDGNSNVYVYVDDLDNTGDISVTQTDSYYNKIALSYLNDDQDVSVDITVYGDEESSTIANLETLGEFDTDLEVVPGEDSMHGSAGIDTLTVRSSEEYGASQNVNVIVHDAWAVGEMTLDAKEVVTGETGGVFINASQEDDAALTIYGSTTADNIILGGWKGDSIVGGAGNDILQGDSIGVQRKQVEVTFADEYDVGDVIKVTIGSWEVTATITGDARVTGEAVAAAFAAYLTGTGDPAVANDVSGDDIAMANTGTWSEIHEAVGAEADDEVLTLSTGYHRTVTSEVDNVKWTQVWSQGDANWSGIFTWDGQTYYLEESSDTWGINSQHEAFEAAVEAAGGSVEWSSDLQTLTIYGPEGGESVPMITDFEGGEDFSDDWSLWRNEATIQEDPILELVRGEIKNEGITADTLTGGDGDDVFVITRSYVGDTMDVITDLNLDDDFIVLGGFFERGSTATADALSDDHFVPDDVLQVARVFNGGAVKQLSGTADAFLATSWEDLIEGIMGVQLEATVYETNTAGLFSVEDRTFLLAVGADKDSTADDFVVEVTGVSGTLTLDNFTVPFLAI